MIKVYGSENCPMCKTLKMWIRSSITTIEAQYHHVDTKEETEELANKYNVFGFPVIVDDTGGLMTFNELMDKFKDNRS